MNKNSLSSISAQVIFDAAVKKGLRVKIISARLNLLKIFHNHKYFFVKGTSFPVNPQPACFIANNKFLTKKVLKAFDIPMPKSWIVRTPAEAIKLISKINLYPCVLKPVRGAHGHKVYANINSFEEFKGLLPYVFSKSSQNSVLVEEHIAGKDYRLLVVGDQVSAVMERIPAHVIGDGVNTINQLIRNFNHSPLVGKKYEKPMCKIIKNGEVKRNLNKLNKSFSDVPAPNEMIFLRQNANISTGGIGVDATNDVSQTVKDLAINATKALGLVISGVDIIYNDLTNTAYIIELNDMPGIDIHHYPVYGQSRPVADDILTCLLSKL